MDAANGSWPALCVDPWRCWNNIRLRLKSSCVCLEAQNDCSSLVAWHWVAHRPLKSWKLKNVMILRPVLKLLFFPLVWKLISGGLFWADIRDNDVLGQCDSILIDDSTCVFCSDLWLWEGVWFLTQMHLLQYLCFPFDSVEAFVPLSSLCCWMSVTDHILAFHRG